MSDYKPRRAGGDSPDEYSPRRSSGLSASEFDAYLPARSAMTPPRLDELGAPGHNGDGHSASEHHTLGVPLPPADEVGGIPAAPESVAVLPPLDPAPVPAQAAPTASTAPDPSPSGTAPAASELDRPDTMAVDVRPEEKITKRIVITPDAASSSWLSAPCTAPIIVLSSPLSMLSLKSRMKSVFTSCVGCEVDPASPTAFGASSSITTWIAEALVVVVVP